MRCKSVLDAAADAAIACLDIAEPGERLACLDSATREIAATRIRSESAEESAAADAGRVYANENATEEESFGAEALPSVKSAKREKKLGALALGRKGRRLAGEKDEVG